MRYFILLPVVFLSLYTLTAYATPSGNSIREKIPSLQGDARLKAYADLCSQLSTQNNMQAELSAIHNYIAEANRQKNTEQEGNARSLLLFAYYNNNLADSMEAALPKQLDFMKGHKQWTLYYACRSLRVERFNYDQRPLTALKEAETIYEESKQNKNNYGQGIAAYLIATCYQGMARYKEAMPFYIEGEKRLAQEHAIGPLLNLYAMAWQNLSATRQYTLQLDLTKRWMELLDTYCIKNRLTPDDLSIYYLYAYLSRANAQMLEGKLPEARNSLNQAEYYAKGVKPISQMILFKEQARYEELQGNFARALELTDQCIRTQNQYENRAGQLASLQVRAGLLLKLRRIDEFTPLYQEVLAAKDSIHNQTALARLNELATLYQVDYLQMERDKSRLRMIIAIGGCALLALLLIGYIIHYHRLKNKNRLLYLRIREQERGEQREQELLETIPTTNLSKEELLFRKLTVLMQQQQCFTSEDLKRKDLADMLGTNETYLADAIRICTGGQTFGQYITALRLKFAAYLLVEQLNISIEEVSYSAGFSSRSTFFRVFKEQFGMSPNEFRKVSLSTKQTTKTDKPGRMGPAIP